MSDQFELVPIGFIKSCFNEKLTIPRQSGLTPSATATLTLVPPFNDPDALRGLEQSSHIWLEFIFHQHSSDQWRPLVRPPRLGGNQKHGVFATRSPFRPNRLGLSVVRLDSIEGCTLQLSGVDVLNGTPVVDIKPYVPYADCLPDADYPLARHPPKRLAVDFAIKVDEPLKTLLTDVLSLDPRPAYHDNPHRIYRCRISEQEVSFTVNENRVEVLDVQ